MYIYTYIHIYMHTYIHVYIREKRVGRARCVCLFHTDVFFYTYVQMYVHIYLYTYIPIYIHIYICTYIHLFRYLYIHTAGAHSLCKRCVCLLHKNVFIYTHIHIHIHIYTYTHTYTYMRSPLNNRCVYLISNSFFLFRDTGVSPARSAAGASRDASIRSVFYLA